ncbi:MAG: DUF3298 domain-containing protein [Bacteroidetes bacterium]|jgi:hypothetical protein|nr:DUF3298 domain-containing protein [Bacteroidota bacterium]
MIINKVNAAFLKQFFVCASATLVAGTGQAQEAQSGQNSIPNMKLKGFTVQNLSQKEKYSMVSAGTKDSAFCSYDVSYQIFNGKGKTKKLAYGLNQLMHSAITTDTAHWELPMQKRVEQDAREFKAEWEGLNSDPNGGWTFNYTKEQKFAAFYANRHYVSVKDQAYYFTGGAHGFRVTIFTLVDIKSGNPVDNWHKLFTDSNAVLKIAENIFRKNKQIPESENINKSWFWNGKFYLPNNFAYTEKGILFFYNVYEIAPYEQGDTELLLDYESLGKLLIKPNRK